MSKDRNDCPRCKLKVKDGFLKGVNCKGIDYVDICPTNTVPKLSKSNLLFWDFYQKISPSIYTGMGGYNMSHLPDLFKVYGVSKGQQPIFYNKLFIVFSEIDKNKAERIEELKHA